MSNIGFNKKISDFGHRDIIYPIQKNKRKTLLVTLFMLRVMPSGYTQNLIQSDGFESYYWVPFWAGSYYLVDHWNNCSGVGSPDYYHLDAIRDPALPGNYANSVMPYEGSAVMGLFMYESDSSVTHFREYLDQQLEKPLVMGRHYMVTFYVTNGTGPFQHGGYGYDQFSVAFSTNPLIQYFQAGSYVIEYNPQYIYPGILYSNDWQQITYSFVADSAYQYITFGSFVNDSVQQIQQFDEASGTGGVNYSIDNVSLKMTTTNTPVGNAVSSVVIAPNPVVQDFDISFKEFDLTEVIILNTKGRIGYHEKGSASQSPHRLNPDLPAGLYIVQLKNDWGKTISKKLIKL